MEVLVCLNLNESQKKARVGRVEVKSISCVRLFATPWTVARQAPPSPGFSRQEHWSGLPFPSLRGLPNPGIKPRSATLQADSLPSEPPGKPYAGDLGSIPGQGTRCHMPKLKILCATTKTRCSQINKY